MKKALVIGGGFGGCTAVHELKRLGDWYVTLVDPSNELGAGVRTRFYCGHPYTFGPRHFLTQNEHVYEYLLKHLDLRLCKEHQFITFVESDSQFYNYPIHYDDIKRMPDAASVYKEIGELEELYRDATFNLTTGSPLLERNSNNYEDFWVRSVGPTLYKKFIDKYTKKMWMIDNNSDIDDFSWSLKV